jgi:hypothetical protein
MALDLRIACRLLLQVPLAVGLAAVGTRACDRPGGVSPTQARAYPAGVSIPFEGDDSLADVDVLSVLEPIVSRAWSDLATRVLVVGVANERSSLLDNLELANRRARVVSEHLLARGVADSQLAVAAREAAPDDRRASRCEVEIVAPPLAGAGALSGSSGSTQ